MFEITQQRILIAAATAVVGVFLYRYFFKRKTREQIELEQQYRDVLRNKTKSQWEQ